MRRSSGSYLRLQSQPKMRQLQPLLQRRQNETEVLKILSDVLQTSNGGAMRCRNQRRSISMRKRSSSSGLLHWRQRGEPATLQGNVVRRLMRL